MRLRFESAEDAYRILVLSVGDQHAAGLNAGGKFCKRIDDIVLIAIVIQVVLFDVQQDRGVRMQVQKTAVVLTRFGDKSAAVSDSAGTVQSFCIR